MKAVFYPVGDKNRASSRYRVWRIIPERAEFDIGNMNWKAADALIFQRTFDGHHLDIARRARKAGKLVILDITDAYFYRHRWKEYWPTIQKFAKIANCLTTGNEDDAQMLRIVLKRRCYVVSNAQRMSKRHRRHVNVSVPTVVWIGRENTMLNTLGGIWPVLQRLSMSIRFRVLIVNDTGNVRGLALPHNEVVGRRWKLDEVHSVISKCDIGVCPQVKQADGRYHKDVNKAVTCWTCGVACVTFGRTKNWEGDLRRLLTDWRFRNKQGYKGITRAKKWSPSVVAKRWLEVINEELGRL